MDRPAAQPAFFCPPPPGREAIVLPPHRRDRNYKSRACTNLQAATPTRYLLSTAFAPARLMGPSIVTGGLAPCDAAAVPVGEPSKECRMTCGFVSIWPSRPRSATPTSSAPPGARRRSARCGRCTRTNCGSSLPSSSSSSHIRSRHHRWSSKAVSIRQFTVDPTKAHTSKNIALDIRF